MSLPTNAHDIAAGILIRDGLNSGDGRRNLLVVLAMSELHRPACWRVSRHSPVGTQRHAITGSIPYQYHYSHFPLTHHNPHRFIACLNPLSFSFLIHLVSPVNRSTSTPFQMITMPGRPYARYAFTTSHMSLSSTFTWRNPALPPCLGSRLVVAHD